MSQKTGLNLWQIIGIILLIAGLAGTIYFRTQPPATPAPAVPQ